MADQEAKRTVLVAVVGGSPAVVTEALWSLTQEKGERVDEVRVITTRKGKESVLRTLLGAGQDRFKECCLEWGIDPARIKFDESKIEVLIGEGGGELDDIRNTRENELAADQICSLIRRWTADGSVKVHCSAAGGRKTMSIYLTIALMLYGRPQDRLWHVLVEPADLERCEDFFYPYKQSRDLIVKDHLGKVLKRIPSAEARIDLAAIPFVSLRSLRAEEVESAASPGSAVSYNHIVRETQERLRFLTQAESASVTISKAQRPHWTTHLFVAGSVFRLTKAQGLLYCLVAYRRKMMCGGDGGLGVGEITSDELIHVFQLLTGMVYEPTLRITNLRFVVDWVEQARSDNTFDKNNLKAAIEQAITKGSKTLRRQGLPERFIITNANEQRREQPARYTLPLPPESIVLP